MSKRTTLIVLAACLVVIALVGCSSTSSQSELSDAVGDSVDQAKKNARGSAKSSSAKKNAKTDKRSRAERAMHPQSISDCDFFLLDGKKRVTVKQARQADEAWEACVDDLRDRADYESFLHDVYPDEGWDPGPEPEPDEHGKVGW